MNKKVLFGGIAALLLATAAYVYFRYFSIKDDQIKYLPKNAALVVKIDAASLANKADWLNLMQSPEMKKIMEKANNNNDFKKFIENPKESGFNPVSNFYITTEFNPEQTNLDLFLSVLDGDKAIQTIKKMYGSSSLLIEKNGIKMVINPGYGETSVFAVTGNTGVFCSLDKNSYDYDESEPNTNKESAEKYILNLLNDQSASMAKSEIFKAMDEMEGDVKLLYNTKTLFSSMGPLVSAVKLPSFAEEFKNYCTLSAMQFNNGEILIKSKTVDQSGKEVTPKTKFISDKPFSKDFLGSYIKSNFNIGMAMKLEMSTIKKVVEESLKQFTGLGSNPETSRQIQSILSSFDGELIGGIFDMKVDQYGSPMPIFEVIAGINGPTQLQSILALAVKNGGIKQNGNVYVLPGETETYLGIFGTRLVITNSKSELSRLSSTGNLQKNNFTTLADKNPMAMEFTIAPKYWPLSLKDVISDNVGPNGQKVMDFIGIFDKMIAKGNFNNAEISIKMNNQEENSLKTILTKASVIVSEII